MVISFKTCRYLLSSDQCDWSQHKEHYLREYFRCSRFLVVILVGGS